MASDRRPGPAGERTPLHVSITARRPLAEDLRAYAEEKVARLARHTALHDVSMVIDNETPGVRYCGVELVVHLHHVRLAASAEAATFQEAVDKVVDRADRQVLRRKDRVTKRKGHVGADGFTAEATGV
jgi:putative sigma-54 modulation protein